MPFLSKRVWKIDDDTLDRRAGDEATKSARWNQADSWGRAHVPSGVNRDRQNCGNPECRERWSFSRKIRRPIFEQQWGCSTRCLERIVCGALRRERSDGLPSTLQQEEVHQHRIPLGLAMFSRGMITQEQLRRALEAQRSAGQGRIGEWLLQECNVPQSQIVRGLAMQWNCPVLPVEGFSPERMALTVPRVLVEEMAMLPLRIAASHILYMAFRHRLDAAAVLAIGQMNELRAESGFLEDLQFERMQNRLLECRFVPVKEESFIDLDMLARRIVATLEKNQAVGSRLVRLHHRYWLRSWLAIGAYSGTGSVPGTDEDVIDTLFTWNG